MPDAIVPSVRMVPIPSGMFGIGALIVVHAPVLCALVPSMEHSVTVSVLVEILAVVVSIVRVRPGVRGCPPP